METLLLPNFPRKFWMCFFKVKHFIGHLRMWLVRLMWNEKEVHRLDIGWTMWPWPLTSPMTLTFDFSRSNFKIAVSEGLLSDWCETKKKQIIWDTGLTVWSCPLTVWSWPWPCSLKVKVWNSLIWGTGVEALIDMERKGCESIIHDNDGDLWVTMLGWVDVPYSNWGNCRRRRAVDISRLISMLISCFKFHQNLIANPHLKLWLSN